MPVRSVTDILKDGCDYGYVTRDELRPAPLTYGYTLTETGRAVAEQAVAKQGAAGHVTALVVNRRAYQLTVAGDVPEVAELLERLKELGVAIEPWDAS